MNAFEKIICEKLANAEYTDPQLWSAVEAKLNEGVSSGKPIGGIKAAFYAGIAASLLFIAAFESLPDLSEHNPVNNTILETVASKSGYPIEDSVDEKSETSNSGRPVREKHEIALTPVKAQNDQPRTVASESLSENPYESTDKKVGQNPEVQKDLEKPKKINPKQLPEIDFKAEGIQCASEDIEFTTSSLSGAEVKWIFDGERVEYGRTVRVAFEEPGLHEVHLVITANGESRSTVKSIEIFDGPTPKITSSQNMTDGCFDRTVSLSAIPDGHEYSWSIDKSSFSGADVSVRLSEGIHSFVITAVNEKGCVTTLHDEIEVGSGLSIFTPKAFTPDDNGQNDTWFPQGIEHCTSFHLQIYRLQGQSLIYETNEVAPWDGSISGTAERPMRGEQFVYKLTATDKCGKTLVRNGSITAL